MSRTAAFVFTLVTIAFGLLNIILIEHKALNNGLPLVHADFPLCTTIHNGPIQRPDHYSAQPHGRRADNA